MAASRRSGVPSERRVFSLVLALVASPAGLTKREVLQVVYGYSERYRQGAADPALERQFERDKDQLRELGIPLEAVDSPFAPGDNKLIRYRISKELLQMPPEVTFTARELALLRLAALAWSEGSLDAESRRSAMKLEALGAGLDVQHLGIAPRLGIPEPAAPALQRAIDEGRVARFGYRVPEREEPLERRVAPLRLHRAEDRWHLLAHDLDRGADRVFLLSRIAGAVRIEAERFDAALRDRADAIVDGLLELQRTRRAVVLARPGSIAEARLAGRAGAAAESGGAESGSAEGPRLLEFGTLDYHELAQELAGYGEQAAVRDPVPLRDAVIERLRRVREQHAPGERAGTEHQEAGHA